MQQINLDISDLLDFDIVNGPNASGGFLQFLALGNFYEKMSIDVNFC